ncbi:MAG: PhoX family phosphatase [Leptolyngbyaceae bacterium]|nr:PhoX family phosphatase [Leptolyngbyaceae bacterium]
MVQDINDNRVSNKSGNRPFEDVLKARMSRRSVLVKGAALSATGFLAGIAADKLFSKPAEAASSFDTAVSRSMQTTLVARANGELVGFNPVTLADAAASDAKTPLISPDYEYQVLIPWGTPLVPGTREWDGDPNNRPTSGEQKNMVGAGHDGMWLFPINDSNDNGVLCINHEFAANEAVYGLDRAAELAADITSITAEEVLRSQYAHGVACVEIKKVGTKWEVVTGSGKNRRITPDTPVEFSGPVAGSEYITNPAGNAPRGTVNNCGNGWTPWGTYLTCEENFNGYFGATGAWTPTEAQDRYGFSAGGFGYGWHVQQERFDLSNPNYANEGNRFGWMVEIDPMNPSKPPVKRTAMGRFKHESGNVVVGSGNRIVVYMGDDERFDYLYKWVSNGSWRDMLRRGISPLDKGVLFVAQFSENGRGAWLPIEWESSGQLRKRFKNQAEVLVNTRIAADILGATPMDRPEWITNVGTDVYCVMTNNSRRTEAFGPNPLAPNPDGHIVKLKTTRNHTGRQFTWEVALISEDTHGTESSIASPDAIYADPEGRLFIGTDGGQKDGLQDQLLVADPTQLDANGRIATLKRLFVGVEGDEITGWATTPDYRTGFTNMQHPGDGDPSRTNFPAATDGVTIPRDCTIVITKKDGGVVGS